MKGFSVFHKKKYFKKNFFYEFFGTVWYVQEAEFLDSFIQVFGRESSQNVTLLENYNY